MRPSVAFALAFWGSFGLVFGSHSALLVISLVDRSKCALGIGTCAAEEPAAPVRWRWPV